MALVQRAYERYSFESSLERAVVAVGEFAFDKAALLRDERDFEACGGDLVEMARRCIEARKERRCNLARVRACISVDNPERALLLQFAAEGVDVRPLLPPEFVPNGPVHASWPRLSGTYARAPRLVNALLSKAFHVPGLAVILPRARITDWGGCNVSTSGWAPKPTGPDPKTGVWAPNNGRPTFNPKLMNVPATKISADAAWGEVHHPDAKSIVCMLVEYHEQQLAAGGHGWEDLDMWKIDANGAYTLQENAPEACRLYLSQLTDPDKQEYMMMYTCGGFGSCFQPGAFDVVTRAARYELARLLKGAGDGYVDDFYGVALRWLCEGDMEAVKSFFRALLGDNAIAEHKCARAHKHRMEIIGWLFDLLHQRVTLSAKCLEKALHGLMSVNEFEALPVKTVQRLASWGVRYGQICPLMHPFVSILYNEMRGMSRKFTTIRLSPLARVAVHMLRALTLLMGVDETNFSRPFESWVVPSTKAGIVVEKDGSLTGLGLLFFAAEADGSRRLVGVSEVDIRSLGFGTDSSLQNTAEYICYIAAIRGADLLRRGGLLINGEPPRGLWLMGDSKSALSWAEKGRVKSERAVNASLACVMQSVKLNMPLLSIDHLPKEVNTSADGISRRAEGSLSLRELVDLDPRIAGADILELGMEPVLALCDPTKSISSPSDLESFWAQAQAVL
ncbi:hypothetical protein B484DRAFT_455519 [Ochromonadaceae sp. CCMP2298]|nr:hypothetical protein B484DRAFT_455519 [Ochromonadaceae sp. CCMP2298]